MARTIGERDAVAPFAGVVVVVVVVVVAVVVVIVEEVVVVVVVVVRISLSWLSLLQLP